MTTWIKALSIVIVFSLFISNLAPAQIRDEEKMVIQWNEPAITLDPSGKVRKKLNFEGAKYIDPFLPLFQFSIPGQISEVIITSPVFDDLTPDEKLLLPTNYSNTSIVPELEIVYENSRPYTLVTFSPIVINHANGTSKKLISFSYQSSPERTLHIKSGSRITSVTTSVLASGDWYKLSVAQSGLYKIDYNFLKSMGINPSSINPKQLKLFGNGGGMLPQENNAFRYDDLKENAIYVEGEADGKFDENDYILFFGKGPDTWSFDSINNLFVHTKNIYSDNAYYFLTIGPGDGLRVTDSPQAIGTPSTTVDYFDDYSFHEQNNENILQSGREWYGEKFDFTLQKDFLFYFPGLRPNSDIRVTSEVMAASFTSTSFSVKLNNNSLGSQLVSAIPSGHYDKKGNTSTKQFTINSSIINNSPNLTINLTYNKSGNNSAIGYLNYLTINSQRNLQLYNNSILFRNKESRTVSPIEYSISNANATYKIWDITDPVNPKNQTYTLNGNTASFIIDGNKIKEYMLFSGSGHSAPSYIEKIQNQNLHGITSPNLPDLVIVTPEAFKSEAQRLANFRTSFDHLTVEVVTLSQVYNEFSSGAPDVTAIRDFMKMLYDRKSGNDSVRYLLLFGDCSYDFKDRIKNNTNIVPIYQSRNSLEPLKTYSSDDYFGFLDNNEGRWGETGGDNHLMDIGVGRLPIKSIDEASAIVNKIIHYHSNEVALGKWRNKITFVADDGDGNLHQKDAEKLSKIVNDNYKVYNVNKLYIDAFQQESSPSGESCPALKQFLDLEVDRGTFIVNYSGHGGETGWSQESILDIPQINKWSNYNNLPFFVTATCAFGRYDDPEKISGAETLVTGAGGGAIGIVTSTRPVYASSNFELNEALYHEIFRSENGNMPRLGDIFRKTKNNSITGVNNRNYALLGDPSMRLEYPEEKIAITKINGNTSLTDTLKALDKITIEGEIQTHNGSLVNDFNGTLYITVYDKMASMKTIGTEGSLPLNFNLRNNFIYEGKASVTSGKFSVTFVVPKDISYQFDYGKVSMYAQKELSILDASGNNENIIIGGSSSTAVSDNTPPEIKLFMNDESFVFGGLTSPNSLLLAKITDDNGVNIAGTGVGHEITGVIDNKEEVIVLNEYYSADLDDYQKGKVEYPLKDITPGNHSVRIKAWDTHNNSSEGYLEFVVANNEKIALENVLNYPNPFSTSTTFHFDHNRAGDDLDVLIQVYTVSGKLIKTIENRYYLSGSHISNGLHWDARDDFGDKLGKGVYIYKVRIRSLRDGSNNYKYQKLVILN